MPQPKGYTHVQIALHWVVFLLVGAQFIFADSISNAFRTFMREGTFTPSALVFSHIAFGVLILLLVVWRMAIKAKRGAPPHPENEPALLKLAATLAHFSLYALLILLPISGGIAWFGAQGWAAQGHVVLKTLLMILVILHVVAAFYHHFYLKTDVLNRMRKPE
jgi:cytochrome b561